MPTTPGDSLPSYIAPSFPSSIDTRRPSIHVAQQHQNSHAHHRRATSQVDVELQALHKSPPTSAGLSPGHGSGSTHHRRNSSSLRVLPSSPHSQPPESAHLLLPHGDPYDSDSDYTYDSGDKDDHDRQMSKRAAKRSTRTSVARQTSTDSLRAADGNGDAANATGSMNGIVEHRRKHAQLDSPTSQAASLISRSSFNLDDPVPALGRSNEDEDAGKGFSELSVKDQRNFLLLVLLYFLQGIPMGLATGSVPFLLKRDNSYGAIGVFSLAAYPYSLKLLWSPIVDAVWTPKLGRRKSWILPIQTVSGFSMLWLGANVNELMAKVGDDAGSGIWGFTVWWFALVFLCATQDIAVDGWALTLLSEENLAFASTAQTVGLTAGQFLSYTVFLAFESGDFANKYFRPESAHSEVGLMTLDGYLKFWGWAYLIVTFGLAIFKREERTKNTDGIMEVYQTMWGILKLKNIQTFIIIHLIAKIGFQANDAVTSLKLLDKGFSQEDLALTILIDFPIEILLGYYIGKWCQTYPPMHIWCWAFVGRLVAAGFAQFVVSIFPAGGTTTWYLLMVICEHVLSTFMNTVMFVAVSAFHAKISDPVIGGTYMTLLATVSNLGGTFPRYFVLQLVDYFTVATCAPPTTPPAADKLKGDLITQAFSCALEADKHRCLDGGGSCNVTTDGYYVMNMVCIVFGVVTFWGYIKPAVMRIQALPLRAWRLSEE